MSDPYKSGEFSIPVGWRSAVAPAAAMFDGKLALVGGGRGGMSQATLSLVTNGKALNIEKGDATDPKNWSTGPLAMANGKALTTPNGSAATCSSSPALAAVGDALTLCWNDTSGALLLSQYKVGDDSKLGWQKSVVLVAAGDPYGGSLVAADGAEVALIALDTTTFLLVCPMVSAWWGTGGQTLFIGSFNVNDLDPRQSYWRARTDIWGGSDTKPVNPPFGTGYDFPSFGRRVGADWFTVATQTANPNEPLAKAPTLQLWVTLAPGDPSLSATLLIPVNSVANGGIGTYQIEYTAANGWKAPSGARVWRDPAGRICCLSPPTGGGSVDVSMYSTWDVPVVGSDPLLPKAGTQMAAPSVGTTTPAFAFFTDMTKTTDDCLPKDTDPKPIAYAVYRFAFYGDASSQQFCQVDRYGTAEVYPNYGSISLGSLAMPKPQYPADMIVVQGIVDGPIPVPAVNFANYQYGPGETVFAELEYGRADEINKEHSVSNSWTVGFKTEGESSKGFGPAWDISLKGGMGSIRTDGTETQARYNVIKKSLLEGERPHQAVDPRGTLFGREVYFDWTAYRFLDASCQPIADGRNAVNKQQAPLFTTVSTRFVPGGAKDFVAYAVQPGDLSSYTVPAINKRMQGLGYPGASYFADVIAPNAYTFADNNNCIEVTWTAAGGEQSANYSQATSQFTESSWSLETEVYVGVSGGGGVTIPIFGEVEEFSFKFLAGVTFSTESKTSVDSSHEWSIGLGDQWGAFGDGQDAMMVSQYTFQIYFLPPPSPSDIFKSKDWPAMGPNYWVKELQLCAPKVPHQQIDPLSIDPNSGAWRIFFVVDSYGLFDGTHYP